MDVRGKETLRRPGSHERLDVAVVGAGPYGLSAAAHLAGRGLKVAVFGKPLELWREHMPRGMMLRSQWRATNLSDPGRRYTFVRFLRDSGREPTYPIPLDTFVEYARWFQQHAVPDVDETYVSWIERREGTFMLTLNDGRRVESDAVVMAIGLGYYTHRPAEFSALPPGLVSHSSDLRDLERFRDRRVVVVGGGQSAVECAALLNEAGAAVDLVSRHPIVWLERDRTGERGLAERILAPDTGIGPGWTNWMLEHAPYLFYRLPQSRKDRAMRFYSGAWAADWLRARIANGVRVHEGHTAVSVDVVDGMAAITLSDGATIHVDHVVLATGYRVDVGRLPMIAPALRAGIEAERGVPVLGPSFDTTVPGLYFIGATSMRSFGPIFRFVLGCRAAAVRVTRAIEMRQRSHVGLGAALRRAPEHQAVTRSFRPREARHADPPHGGTAGQPQKSEGAEAAGGIPKPEGASR